MTKTEPRPITRTQAQTKQIVTLRNDFHGTRVNIRAVVVDEYSIPTVQLTPAQWSRVRRKLCGLADCTCGAVRGPQKFHGKKLIVDRWERL